MSKKKCKTHEQKIVYLKKETGGQFTEEADDQ